MKSRSPFAISDTNARPVRASEERIIGPVSTPASAKVSRRKRPNGSSPTLPTNDAGTPRRARPTATLAGAPPGALRKPGHSARETPAVSATKSISASPRQTTRDFGFWILDFGLSGTMHIPYGSGPQPLPEPESLDQGSWLPGRSAIQNPKSKIQNLLEERLDGFPELARHGLELFDGQVEV